MIKYSSSPRGFYAEVENIKTGKKFIISSVLNPRLPYKDYETAVFKIPGFFLGFMAGSLIWPCYIDHSLNFKQVEDCHKQTAELFEQSNSEKLKHRIEQQQMRESMLRRMSGR